ncbi:MAG: hypothetical protein Tsb0014_42950 [Pleurocapsa sp.]
MTYKLLLTVFLTSLSYLGAIAPIAMAQEPPECYMIDDSGQLTDLTDICNVSEKRSLDSAPTSNTNEGVNVINNNNNIIGSKAFGTKFTEDNNLYILGENDFSFDSGFIDSLYYIDNGIGMDYTAYVRKYRTSPTSITREASRKQAFQFDDYPRSLTSILRRGQSRLPFLIYRYRI